MHHEPVEHPLVRTHPVTGKKAIYVSAPYVTHIRGLSRAESQALLDFLYRHIETSEFIYRHRWSKNALRSGQRIPLERGVDGRLPVGATVLRLEHDS
ncbi:MAG: TauD/TfdA dioxygenase family protein [Archangium sp.]